MSEFGIKYYNRARNNILIMQLRMLRVLQGIPCNWRTLNYKNYSGLSFLAGHVTRFPNLSLQVLRLLYLMLNIHIVGWEQCMPSF